MRVYVIILLLLFANMPLRAAWLNSIPQTVRQPNGQVLNLYATGDEYHHYLHDKNGYTIIQDPATGYFVYAKLEGDKLVPSKYKVKTPPKSIKPYTNISEAAYQILRREREADERSEVGVLPTSVAKSEKAVFSNSGTLNNIVFFVRFSDDLPFTVTPTEFESMFNDRNIQANSLYNYYKTCSFGKLDLITSFLPKQTAGQPLLSYIDNHPRNYFRPYSATNPSGYSGEVQKADRVQNLMRSAIIALRDSIPSDLDIDFNSDGKVDNVCFIVQGDAEGWSELLWPQEWHFDENHYVSINGKVCYTYNFQLENYSKNNVGVLCHEMFHSLGAPDLYHYNSIGVANYPVAHWDVMELTTEPPQQMGAYMKYKYGRWIDTVPVITTSGFYELNPLATDSENIVYKIPVPETDGEYLIVEYRKRTGTFESALPQSGLLIYRIWPHVSGNQYANGTTVFDEVYVYRPGGGYSDKYDAAAYSTSTYHSNFYKDVTDPACVLTGGQFGSVGVFGATPVENGKIRFYVAIGDTAKYLFSENEYVSVPATENNREMQVYTNGTYEINTDAAWLTATPTPSASPASKGAHPINIISQANTGAQRTGRVTLALSDNPQIKQIIVVSQSAGNTLEVDPRSQTISGSAGSNAEYTVTSSVSYTATTTAAWVGLDISDSIVTATALTNNTQPQARQAIIKVSSGGKNVNATLIQEVYDDTPIEEVERLPMIEVYPNPTTGTLYIRGDIRHAVITDIYGKTVWSGADAAQSQTPQTSQASQQSQQLKISQPTHEISLENFPNGIYLLNIPNCKTTKIILTKNSKR
jgi:M6 family metalloprotease-like protein